MRTALNAYLEILKDLKTLLKEIKLNIDTYYTYLTNLSTDDINKKIKSDDFDFTIISKTASTETELKNFVESKKNEIIYYLMK